MEPLKMLRLFAAFVFGTLHYTVSGTDRLEELLAITVRSLLLRTLGRRRSCHRQSRSERTIWSMSCPCSPRSGSDDAELFKV